MTITRVLSYVRWSLASILADLRLTFPKTGSARMPLPSAPYRMVLVSIAFDFNTYFMVSTVLTYQLKIKVQKDTGQDLG